MRLQSANVSVHRDRASDSPLQKRRLAICGATVGSPSSGLGIANECDSINVSCAATRSNIEHGVLGIGAGVGIQAVAGNQLTLEFAADVCITSPQRFGRWMFRVGRCPRMMLELVLQAYNISQQGIQVLCR